MIKLESTKLAANIDPDHGGEIVDLCYLPNSIPLLAQVPTPGAIAATGDIDDVAWVGAYRGGWQLVAPNAGNACQVDGVFHGFHGGASTDAWTVIQSSKSKMDLEWSGHGLNVTRILELLEDRILVSTRFKAVRDRVPLVTVEHIAFNKQLLTPNFQVSLPGGMARESTELEKFPKDVGELPWPDVRMLDGSLGTYETFQLDEAGALFVGVSKLNEGWARLKNPRLDVAVEVLWDLESFPYLWIWYENRTTEAVWRKELQVIGIEPSTVLYPQGLAQAIENGQARWLDTDQCFSTWCAVKVNEETFLR